MRLHCQIGIVCDSGVVQDIRLERYFGDVLEMIGVVISLVACWLAARDCLCKR